MTQPNLIAMICSVFARWDCVVDLFRNLWIFFSSLVLKLVNSCLNGKKLLSSQFLKRVTGSYWNIIVLFLYFLSMVKYLEGYFIVKCLSFLWEMIWFWCLSQKHSTKFGTRVFFLSWNRMVFLLTCWKL